MRRAASIAALTFCASISSARIACKRHASDTAPHDGAVRMDASALVDASPVSGGIDGGVPIEATSDPVRADASIAFDPAHVLARARVPAVAYAAVTRDGDVLLGARGDAFAGNSATTDTLFEAASIAKTIIAACVMQLVEIGKVDLDADVSGYVGFPVQAPGSRERITLRRLLTHRASVKDREIDLLAPREGNPLGPFLKRYFVVAGRGRTRADAFIDAPPGTTTRYSNAGAALAAYAVEHVGGESFADYSERHIFAPLRMTKTTWKSARPEDTDVARPHAFRGARFDVLPDPSHAVYPVVDMRSTANDLARFSRALLREGELDGKRILSPASVRTMLRATEGDPDQAIGWQIRTIGGARVAGHEGEDAGASTALFLDLAHGSGALLLANGDAFTSGDAQRADALGGALQQLLATARAK